MGKWCLSSTGGSGIGKPIGRENGSFNSELRLKLNWLSERLMRGKLRDRSIIANSCSDADEQLMEEYGKEREQERG
jgi:hypothetical protein